jgi:MFS family permease
MGDVGHSRAFAAFVAIGTIGTLAHMVVLDPYAWAVMRMLTGFCVAGCYTIIESWLQARVTNETRGRAMGTYRVVDILGSLGAQLLIGVLEPAAYVSYNVLAIICCAAMLPFAMTRVAEPETPEAPRLRPALAWACSPLASAGVIVSGVTTAAFRMVGPIYGIEVGLTTDQIALFLAAYVAGGALSQYPAGWFADAYDRRWVLIWLSVLSTAACAIMVMLSGAGTIPVFLAAALFGATTFPIYSVSTAHAHDFAESHQRVELSAALMFLYAVGAIASPLVASGLISAFGPEAMFAFVSAAHLVLIAFGLIRMRRRRAETKTRYVYAPRTSFQIGRLLGLQRDEPPRGTEPPKDRG